VDRAAGYAVISLRGSDQRRSAAAEDPPRGRAGFSFLSGRGLVRLGLGLPELRQLIQALVRVQDGRLLAEDQSLMVTKKTTSYRRESSCDNALPAAESELRDVGGGRWK
jgi:hypothetical protein